ncbi:MAG: PilZ domain-containing protein [Actinomycetota bacterium]|nr:PilZ domain-containing protein [Actinomycetota bacterium]
MARAARELELTTVEAGLSRVACPGRGSNRDPTVTNEDPPLLARRVAWADAGLVEGTEVLLWPAANEADAAGGALPAAPEGLAAVLSWVRPEVVRFETATPEPLAELLLASTLAVGGPARFVVRKSYQIGSTAVCEPPEEIYLVERRELFRVLVAAPVSVWAEKGSCSAHSLDCSAGGVRVYLPWPVGKGAEAVVQLELGTGEKLRAVAAARHCSRYPDGPWVVGFEFVSLPPSGRRQLSKFLAQQERRLMPRVKSLILVECRSHGRPAFAEGLASELSPGAVVLDLYEAHAPGDAMEVKFRLRRQSFGFSGRVVACTPVADANHKPVRHRVTVCLEAPAGPAEEQVRKALRDLALENLASG